MGYSLNDRAAPEFRRTAQHGMTNSSDGRLDGGPRRALLPHAVTLRPRLPPSTNQHAHRVPIGDSDRGFRFRMADIESGSAATRPVLATMRNCAR